jgi:hypothetical protein
MAGDSDTEMSTVDYNERLVDRIRLHDDDRRPVMYMRYYLSRTFTPSDRDVTLCL